MKKLYIEVKAHIESSLNIDKARIFNKEANIIAEMYSMIRPRGQLDREIKKIVVELTDKDIGEFDIICGDKICFIKLSFDFDLYQLKSGIERKKIITDLIQKGIIKASNNYSWDMNTFVTAYNKLIESNYSTRFLFTELKKSRNKKLLAGIEVNLEPVEAQISALYYDINNNLVNKVLLYTTDSHSLFWSMLIRHTKWINNEEFVLMNKSREINFKSSVENDEVELYFTPKKGNMELIKYELQMAKIKVKSKILDFNSIECK
jgi:hypothetical protein